jgi:hypothetical protein
MRFRVATAVLLITFSFHAKAAELDHASEEALQKTQAMLGDQKAMQDYAKTNPDAAKTMNQVSSLTGGNEGDSAAVYKLAADIFATMAKDSNGDPAAMQKALTEAMKNPQAFADKLSPEERQKLQSVSKSIEARAPSSGPH